MALLGTGANVQCTGYFPGYMFGAESSTWTSSNCNGDLKSDCCLNDSFPAASPAQFLGYNRELLKQTILKHEAIFRDQIHDLHRLYQKQRELMDELKRNELHKHNLRLETSWSSSTLSHISSKNDQKTCCSPSLPWLTDQSSILMAESIQCPLGSMRVNNKQLCLAPVPTEGAKDPELSGSKCRKVGKKILDLQLPADQYIDSEGESLEDEGFSKVPRLSTYTLSGVSQLVCNNNDKPSLGSNGANSNDYVDLNALFKLEGKATAKSDDLVGYTCLRNISSHDLSSSTKLCSQNLSNDVILNPKKRLDIDACSDHPPLEQKKHGRLFYTNSVGRNGTKQLFVSSEIFSKKPEYPCFLDQINQGAWSGRKFSSGESSVGAQCSTIDGLVGPNSPLRKCSPYQFVSMGDISSEISPSVLWERPTGDFGQNPIAVQAFPSFGTSTPLGGSSKSLMGMPGFPRDELYHCKSIKSGPNFDRSTFLLSSFCSGSKTSDPPLISTNDLNSPDNHRATSHELMKYAKHSEDVGTSKNMRLNITPSGYSDIGALQSNQVTDKENKFQDLERGLPWLKEKSALKGKPAEESKNFAHIQPVLSQPYDLGGLLGFELKVGDSHLGREKTPVHHINGQPCTSSEPHSSRASPSKICKNWSENQKARKIEEGCVLDVKVPCNHANELEEQASPGEHIMKNELEKKYTVLAGHIDLNSCMNEDESMPIDIDLQAPVSPENKESSPPRGESDENQLEMPYRLVGIDNPEEQVRIGAASLVSISSSVAYNGHQMTFDPPPESFASDSLHWFAGIVSSVMDYRENGVKVDFIGNTDDPEELLPAGFDYFEAMTLKLNETKVLDCCCCKRSGQNEEEGGSTSSTQPKKGRTNRGRRRKDFQSEILPSLASLSRYEVTEDLQTIGGLMEAAGTLRSAGRNVLARGKRKSFTSASIISDLLLKQLTDNTKPGIEKRGLMSWGKINRKRRGKRYPARNFQFVLSQEHC